MHTHSSFKYGDVPHANGTLQGIVCSVWFFYVFLKKSRSTSSGRWSPKHRFYSGAFDMTDGFCQVFFSYRDLYNHGLIMSHSSSHAACSEKKVRRNSLKSHFDSKSFKTTKDGTYGPIKSWWSTEALRFANQLTLVICWKISGSWVLPRLFLSQILNVFGTFWLRSVEFLH